MTEYVNIVNCTMGGTFILEGRARVVSEVNGDEKLVDFEDGYGPVRRFVDPNAQGPNVASYIATLNDSPD